MPTAIEDYASQYLNDPSKALFSNTKINRLSQEGEIDFATDNLCILKRISLQTWTSGGGTFDEMSGDFDSTSGDFDSAGGGITYINPFTLPEDVVSIRRVTWRGYKLDPLPQRNFREVFQNATQLGRPFWYVFNNVGQNQIQLFPSPNERLPVIDTDGLFDSTPGDFDSQDGLFDSFGGGAASTNLYGGAIQNSFIVEYFQTPDFLDATIPLYFRRRLLKNYILRGCFNLEGQGQNRKASKYFKARWEMLKQTYGDLLGELHNKPRKLIVNGISTSYFFPGFPVLPIDRFGTAVDTGE